MAIQPAQPFNAFMAGRQARQDEETAGVRNALAQQDIENSQVRNRMVEKQFSQQEVEAALRQTAAGAARLAQSQSPRAEAVKFYPEFAAKLKEQGVDINSMSDDEAREYFGFVAGQAQSKLGVGPAAPERMTPYQQAQIELQREKMNQPQTMSPYEQARIDIEKQKLSQPDVPKETFRPMSPEEVRAAGLPEGTSAQQSSSGKVDVLSRRDNTGALSQKDATTAKMKLTTVSLARKQLQNIKEKFEQGRSGGMNAFGPGQGMLPTQQGKQFDAAVDQMRSTLTALTRVPGVGAMSDYETKLDQSKFPARTDYETVTAEKIQGIEDMLALIENGYMGLLNGNGAPSEGAPPPQQAATAPKRVKVDAQGNVIGN